ncbi:MAG TPA: hypothetical protein VE907_21870 [Gammaproteobacteria bacterium]|nr:hypothetical protein [Gammaproteobacteria bacterium]
MAATLGVVAQSAHAELYYLIVGGIGGEAKYQEQFDKEVASLASVARKSTGDARVTVLQGEKATREAVEKSFASLATKVKPADSFALFLVGHGSYDGEAYKLNLPGPDIDGDGLAKLLKSVPARQQLVVNATSASGAILEKWAGDGRTLITATKSGMERNATRFADHWAKALADGSADINKNGVITAQEAFDYASREVADSFKKAGTLATEHPQLAGGTAARFTVARLGGQAAPATPELAALNAEKDGLDDEIEALRARRAGMANDEYLNQLQALLVKLADVQAKIDAAQGGDRPTNPREEQPAAKQPPETLEGLLDQVQRSRQPEEPPK